MLLCRFEKKKIRNLRECVKIYLIRGMNYMYIIMYLRLLKYMIKFIIKFYIL